MIPIVLDHSLLNTSVDCLQRTQFIISTGSFLQELRFCDLL